jgi:hypothetical protein
MYTCFGGAQVFPAPIATELAVPANTWTTLSGTIGQPPEEGTCDAIECPDLYLDDAAITIAP